MKEKNFVLNVENLDSPVIITVPHGGMGVGYSSWLENFFKKRSRSDNLTENYIKGEKVVLMGDMNVLHIASDVLKDYKVNIISGLLPRIFVDYNRFVPEVAYSDPKIKPFYDYYHEEIDKTIQKLLKYHDKIILFDIHGFGKQPIEGKEFDIILGTNDGETSPNNFDRIFYNFLSNDYSIFVSELNNLPKETEIYKGDTTNLYYYKKYGIDAILVEIAPKFRKGEFAKEKGQKISSDLALFFKKLESNIKEI